MTNLRDLLEDFSIRPAAAPTSTGPTFDEAALEAQKLEAFENGYKAGWDDAVKAQSDDQSRISSALGQHLQDLSFTYNEAYGQVINAMTPLLDEMVNALLPEIARASLGAHIAEQLTELARNIGQTEVIVAVAPSVIDTIKPMLQQEFGFPISLVADDTLAEEQADIRFDQTEKQVDLGEVLRSVSEAVQGFAHENRRKVANG